MRAASSVDTHPACQYNARMTTVKLASTLRDVFNAANPIPLQSGDSRYVDCRAMRGNEDVVDQLYRRITWSQQPRRALHRTRGTALRLAVPHGLHGAHRHVLFAPGRHPHQHLFRLQHPLHAQERGARRHPVRARSGHPARDSGRAHRPGRHLYQRCAGNALPHERWSPAPADDADPRRLRLCPEPLSQTHRRQRHGPSRDEPDPPVQPLDSANSQ